MTHRLTFARAVHRVATDSTLHEMFLVDPSAALAAEGLELSEEEIMILQEAVVTLASSRDTEAEQPDSDSIGSDGSQRAKQWSRCLYEAAGVKTEPNT